MKTICFIILLLSLSSCVQQKGESNIRCISAPTSTILQKVALSDIASDIELIPLETNDNSLINEIRKISYAKDFLYIADGLALYKYDSKGCLVYKLERQGRGPEEYIYISDFQINETGDAWILCRNSSSLYKYQDSILIDKIALEDWVSNIFLIDEAKMLLYIGNEATENNKHQLKLLDLESKCITNYYLPINDKKSQYLHVQSSNHFVCDFNSSEDVYFFQVFNDTIYSIDNCGEISSHCYFDINGLNIPTSFFDKEYENIMDFFQRLHKRSYAYGTNWFYENENSFFFSYFHNGEVFLSVIPKENIHAPFTFNSFIANFYSYEYFADLSDLDVFIQKDGTLIFTIYPFKWLENLSDKMQEDEIVKFKEAIGYAEDMNPLLLKVKLK